MLNPFTAPACKISGLKDAGTSLQNSIFFAPITRLLSMLCIVVKVLSRTSAKTKRQKGFRVSNFHWSISSDLMAVKRLMLVRGGSDDAVSLSAGLNSFINESIQ